LIKTVLSLHHRQIPATLHFEQPNPDIDFANSPFYVNTALRDWQRSGNHPLRAGVSSFGIGGTNAHVVLEEAPVIKNSDRHDSDHVDKLLLISAKTETALNAIARNLATHLQQNRDIKLADVAYTLSLGRHHFEHRRMLVCRNVDEAIATLTDPPSPANSSHIKSDRQASVVFMFSGQGSQYVGMARELYEHVPVFREHLDRCCELLNPLLGLDLRQILYPPQVQISEMQERLQQTAIAQPAIFAIAYSLAQLWLAWGIKPIAMIGHSIGEYVAACLAGVFTLEEALNLVAMRGRLMQQLPKGAMLVVSLSEAEIQPLITQNPEPDVAIAALNAPNLSVVSGTFEAINRLEQELTTSGIDCRRLHTSHAFHSAMMEPMLAEFQSHLAKVHLHPPQIPYISNVSGNWITPAEAIDPAYWVRHIRQTVRFSDGIQQLFHNPSQILLEVGAGKTLSTLVRRHSQKPLAQIVLNSLRHPQEQSSDFTYLLNTLGQLWLGGISVDWTAFYRDQWRHRLPLPTYPFERQRFWISPPARAKTTSPITEQRLNLDSWFYTPFWKSAIANPTKPQKSEKDFWLVFLDPSPWSDLLLQKLRQTQPNLITVATGTTEFTPLDTNSYSINPNSANAYGALLDDVMQRARRPSRILHFWNVTAVKENPSLEDTLSRGFYSLLYLAQALGKYSWENNWENHGKQGLQISVISNQIQAVTEDESLQPAKATVLGACKVIPKEYPQIQCQSIDIVLPVNHEQSHDRWIDQAIAELAEPIESPIVAYRGNRRWLPTYEPVLLAKQLDPPRLTQGGVYVITGGLGGLGLVLAEHLAKTLQAKLLLIGRSAIPERSQWTSWLENHAIDDRTSQQILKLQEIEATGAEVLAIAADVTNLSQMQVAIAQAEQQWGQIQGVFHTAGVAGGGAIQQKSSAEAAKVMAPKIQGTLVLEQIFQDQPLDFFVLYSSLTAVLGAFGQVDYCAANAFLDAYTYAHNLKKTKFVTSINWNAWRDVGMAVNTKSSSSKFQSLQQESLKYAIAPLEGVEALTRILGSTLSQAIVTPQSLDSLWEQTSAFIDPQSSDLTNESPTSQLYPRPRLNSIYVAPSNDTEKAIASIWQQLLRIDKVGINDNFFELGGDSLLGVQLIARLNKELNAQVAAHSLYQAPTVSSIAEIIAPSSDQDASIKAPSRGDLRRARKMQRP